MLHYVEAQADPGGDIALETMELNVDAQAFFARLGFAVTKLSLRKRAAFS